MPHYHCLAPGCTADSRKNSDSWKYKWMQNVTFHPFPTPQEKLKKWLDLIRREPTFNPTRYDRICSLHFMNGIGPTIEHPYPARFEYNNYLKPLSARRQGSIEIPTSPRAFEDSRGKPSNFFDKSPSEVEILPYDDEVKALLSAASLNASSNSSVMYNPLRPNDQTVGCVGCFRRLQVGLVPKGLNFPSGSGVNVWCKVPEAIAYVPPAGSVLTPTTSQKNMINLCNDCFSGHVSGRKAFNLNVLGISIVTALYKEDTKYLKVEGPTKVVTLGGESDSELSLVVSEGPTKKVPIPAKRKYPGRKILRPLTPPPDKGSDEVSESSKVRKPLRRCRTQPAATSSTNTTSVSASVTNPVDYLSVGSGYLGSVEMTDDCDTYEQVRIKQEPPDESEVSILPEAQNDCPLTNNFIGPDVKMEADDMNS